MKQYLKMADVFPVEIRTDDESGSLICDEDGIILESFSGDKVADYTLHAINSHDELVQMNQELLGQILVLESRLMAAKRSWPDKCPITRRDFFMEIDGVPTYGGPYDSYTIPEMLGTPEQPWHDRELFVRRFDHDRGCWVDDEIISQRVIHDGVLDDLLDEKELSMPQGWQLVPVEPTENMIGHGCGASVMVVSEVIKAWAAMLAAAPKPEGGAV